MESLRHSEQVCQVNQTRKKQSKTKRLRLQVRIVLLEILVWKEHVWVRCAFKSRVFSEDALGTQQTRPSQ